MSDSPSSFSPQGEKVLITGFGVGLLSVLALGFAVLGAPLEIPLIVCLVAAVCIGVVRRDVRHVLAYGWHGSADADGPSGHGHPGGPSDPTPPDLSGSGLEVDWDRFAADFWAHVARQRPRRHRPTSV